MSVRDGRVLRAPAEDEQDDGMRLVFLVTAGAAGLALLLVGLWYLGAWIVAEPRRIGGVLMLVAGLGLMGASFGRMRK